MATMTIIEILIVIMILIFVWALLHGKNEPKSQFRAVNSGYKHQPQVLQTGKKNENRKDDSKIKPNNQFRSISSKYNHRPRCLQAGKQDEVGRLASRMTDITRPK